MDINELVNQAGKKIVGIDCRRSECYFHKVANNQTCNHPNPNFIIINDTVWCSGHANQNGQTEGGTIEETEGFSKIKKMVEDNREISTAEVIDELVEFKAEEILPYFKALQDMGLGKIIEIKNGWVFQKKDN